MISEVLRAKHIDAHEKLWQRILELRNVPSPYGTMVNLLSFMSPSELSRAKDKPEVQFKIADKGLVDWLSTTGQMENLRLYIDDQLWAQASSRIRFVGRLVLLSASDGPGDISKFYEDEIAREAMSVVFSQSELSRFDFERPGETSRVTKEWDLRILAKIREAIWTA